MFHWSDSGERPLGQSLARLIIGAAAAAADWLLFSKLGRVKAHEGKKRLNTVSGDGRDTDLCLSECSAFQMCGLRHVCVCVCVCGLHSSAAAAAAAAAAAPCCLSMISILFPDSEDRLFTRFRSLITSNGDTAAAAAAAGVGSNVKCLYIRTNLQRTCM